MEDVPMIGSESGRYELHCHTNYSRCSDMSPRTLLRIAKKRGLSGICVTDHDTIEGALAVQRLNKDKMFKVILGTEFSTPIGHVLGIFLKKRIPYEKRRGSVAKLIEDIHVQGGLAILAHPGTRTRKNRLKVKDIEGLQFDAIEVYNARNVFAFENDEAVRLAKTLKLPGTVGSDAHFSYELGRNTVGSADLYADIKAGRCKFYYKNPRFSLLSFCVIFLSKGLKIMKRIF